MKKHEEQINIPDILNSMVCSTDSQGVFLYINKSGINMLGGKSKMDFIGTKSIFDFFDSRYDLRKFCKLAVLNDHVKSFNTIFCRLDRQKIKVNFTASTVNENGALNGFDLFIIDMTNKPPTHPECSKSSEIYKTIVKNSLVSLSIHHNGIIQYVNQRYCDAIGFPKSEVIGKPFWLRIHPSDRSRVKELALKVEAGDIGDARATFQINKSDGSISWIESRLSHAVLNGKNIAVVNSFGVTKRKLAEIEIRQLTRRLINIKEDERAKLAADLHDELGQKLAAIHLDLDLLHGMIRREDLKQRQSCQNITEHVEKIATILRYNSLYRSIQIMDNMFLTTAVQQHIDDFKRTFPDIQISFRQIGFKDRLVPEVELSIYRVIQEGITNVAKHAKAKKVEIILTYNYPYVFLTISDDGIGFKIAIDKEFEKNPKDGIGLYNMKVRITSLGGTLEIKTTQGKGSLIRAQIPV